MGKESEEKEKTSQSGPPEPEVLKVQSDGDASSSEEKSEQPRKSLAALRRHGTYRPSHKATFIGLTVVIVILLINAGLIAYLVMQGSGKSSEVTLGGVTLSPSVLNSLGVSRNPVGISGTELVVNPNAQFKGSLVVGSDTSMGGQLKLNGKLTGSDASLTQLQAGKTAVDELNVNGTATASDLNLRKDLTVMGSTKLQGSLTVSQLLTVNNNLTVTGNLSIGGTLFITNFQTNILTVGGHIITRGSAPSVSSGPAVGSYGTVSISGNDASGTVAVNAGTGAGNGVLANVTFNSQYSNIPHVVVSIVGRGSGSYYTSRSTTGFSIGVNGSLPPGGYAFDYIIMQ